MPKLADLNLAGGEFCVCDICGTLYIKYAGYKVNQPCPKCGGRLLLKVLTRGDIYYEVDERSV